MSAQDASQSRLAIDDDGPSVSNLRTAAPDALPSATLLPVHAQAGGQGVVVGARAELAVVAR